MMWKPQLASLAMFSLVAAPVPLAAQTPPAVVQQTPIVVTGKIPQSSDILVRTVFIGDLNLASAAGQQEMEKRVGKAVDDMCAVIAPLPSYKGQMEKPCRDEAWASARWQMNDAVKHAAGAGR